MAEDDPFEHTRMSLGDHIAELRTRLVRGIVAVLVAFVVSWSYYHEVAELVVQPYNHAAEMLNEERAESLEEELAADPTLDRGEYFDERGELRVRVENLTTLSVHEGFLFALKTCFYFALFIGGPVLIYQLWRFIAAGLYPHERRASMRYLPYSILLFLGGVVFGYKVMVPYALFYLGSAFSLETFGATYTLGHYMSFLTTLTLALGAVFQLPVVMVFLARIGVIEVATMRKYRGHVIVSAFILSALLTPPDPVTQSLMAVPIVILYEVGILCSKIAARPRRLPGDGPPGESSP